MPINQALAHLDQKLLGRIPLVIGVTGHRDLRGQDRHALKAEVRDVLVRTQFFMHDPVTRTTSHRNHWLLPPDQDQTALALTAVANQLARTVPCVRIPVTNSPATLAARVAALFDHAATRAAGPGGRG